MSHPTEHGSRRPLGDSAGQPWEGRRFEENANPNDDGSTPAALSEAVARFLDGSADEEGVVDALRTARLLIPLVAHLGEGGLNEEGARVDKKQELSIVTVAGPDGRSVLPVFGSVAAMSRWNPLARPVPADGRRVALAAAAENTELVVLDPTTPGEFVVRRPALWAMARDEPWMPSYRDPAVGEAFGRLIGDESAVRSFTLSAGDPRARLRGPELLVALAVVDGLTREDLEAIIGRLGGRWAADETIASRVDSLSVRVKSAAGRPVSGRG